MRILIAEDDMASRKFLARFLSKFGECDITVDGMEAIEAFMVSFDIGKPYDLICLDIMMPKLDGIKVLKTIREIEKQKGIHEDEQVKVIMTSAINELDTVNNSFETGSEAYATKPINTEKFEEVMKKLGLIK
ncbi:MAG TPA: response regulator [Pseudobacteroides sp.]|nr:response regulator [Pseudobacteroides sp.]